MPCRQTSSGSPEGAQRLRTSSSPPWRLITAAHRLHDDFADEIALTAEVRIF